MKSKKLINLGLIVLIQISMVLACGHKSDAETESESQAPAPTVEAAPTLAAEDAQPAAAPEAPPIAAAPTTPVVVAPVLPEAPVVTPTEPTTPTEPVVVIEPAPLAPTWAQVNELIFDVSCVGCHSGSRPRAGVNLETYASVIANLAAIQNAVFVKKSMPKGGSLTEEELTLLKTWITAGAPEVN